jgi:hypothetical protein
VTPEYPPLGEQQSHGSSDHDGLPGSADVSDGIGSTAGKANEKPAPLRTHIAALGGVTVLVAFLAVPALAGGMGGSRTGRQIAAMSDRLWPLGLFWFLPAAGVILTLLGMRRTSAFSARRRRAVVIIVVAGLAALGQVAALVALQRPGGAAAAFAAGIDPTSAVGPAYWLSLAGLAVATAGAGFDLLVVGGGRDPSPQRGEPGVSPPGPGVARGEPRVSPGERGISPGVSWQIIAGAAAGIVLGTIIASVVLGVRQDAAHRGIVLLGADTFGEAVFGPDFATERVEVAPPTVSGGEVAGDSETLYGGLAGGSSCERDGLAAFVATASPAWSDAWANAVSSDAYPPPPNLQQYVTDLTPAQLRADTRVTAYQFIGKHAIPFQATLQAGTAVLIDARGIPRVRCTGAIPLTPPRGIAGEPEYLDARWQGFDPATLTTVTPSPNDVRQFGLMGDKGPFRRPAGTNGDRDVQQVPEQALIDGTYQLDGKQSTCNLNDCEKAMTLTLTVIATGCPDRCQIAGNGWDGPVEITGSAGTWRASGTSNEPFSCHDTAVQTSFTLTLHAETGQVRTGLWTAETIAGTFEKNSPSGACNAGALSWDISGTRQ